MDHTVPIRFSGYAGRTLVATTAVWSTGTTRTGSASPSRARSGRSSSTLIPTSRQRRSTSSPHGACAHGAEADSPRRRPNELYSIISNPSHRRLHVRRTAEEDYHAVLGCGGDLQGMALIAKDLEGELSVEQTDHMVREGMGLGTVGLAIGLAAPPLLATTAIGAGAGAEGLASSFTTRPLTSSRSRRVRRSRSAALA